MKHSSIRAFAALAASLSCAPALADPCATQIVDAQADFDGRLHADAAAGPTAVESNAATMHRQPTPNTVARAEEKLGDLSPEKTQAFEAAMNRARAADAAGEAQTCEAALDEARAALK